MSEPRDAALTAAWASALDEKRRRWPRWALPCERPRGWKAAAWLLWLVFMLVGAALACRVAWDVLPGLWHWLVVAFIAYTVATTPFTIARMLRTYWNASRAAETNRGLLEHEPVAT